MPFPGEAERTGRFRAFRVGMGGEEIRLGAARARGTP